MIISEIRRAKQYLSRAKENFTTIVEHMEAIPHRAHDCSVGDTSDCKYSWDDMNVLINSQRNIRSSPRVVWIRQRVAQWTPGVSDRRRLARRLTEAAIGHVFGAEGYGKSMCPLLQPVLQNPLSGDTIDLMRWLPAPIWQLYNDEHTVIRSDMNLAREVPPLNRRYDSILGSRQEYVRYFHRPGVADMACRTRVL